MIINWYGEGSFKIQSGGVVILTDPFESSTGLTPPRFKSDLVLTTGAPREYVSDKLFETKNIIGPGEYEVKGVEIFGFQTGAGSVYVVKTEDLKMGVLGGISNADDLKTEALEALGGCDILFLPVGGEPYLDFSAAVKLVKKIEPKIVVPCFYKIAGLKRTASGVESFEKELGQKSEPQEKLVIKIKDIIWEGTKLFVLKI